VLFRSPPATNSAKINISGKSIEIKGKIQLFVDDNMTNETEIEKNGVFKFEEIEIREGDNFIKVRLKKDEKITEFSKEYTITYRKSEPKLEVSTPQDNASFGKDDQEINIQGKTDYDNKVTVNGFWAIVDSEGNFSYILKLNNGENKIIIEAQDPAGNMIKKEITATYNP